MSLTRVKSVIKLTRVIRCSTYHRCLGVASVARESEETVVEYSDGGLGLDEVVEQPLRAELVAL